MVLHILAGFKTKLCKSVPLHDHVVSTDKEIWINTKMTTATNLTAAANLKKPEMTPEELVPKEYHKYLDIFDEEKANCFPESQPYNHKIEMKAGFEPKAFKGYNLTPEEQTKLDKFLKENLAKGYIKLSESPMASPFFFVKKKRWKVMTLSSLPISE